MYNNLLFNKLGAFILISLVICSTCEVPPEKIPTAIKPSTNDATQNTSKNLAVSEHELVYITHAEGISIYNLSSMAKVGEIQGVEFSRFSGFVIDSRGEFGYACANALGTIYKVDLATNNFVSQCELSPDVGLWDIDLTPDDQYIFATLHTVGSVAVLDANTMTLLSQISLQEPYATPNSVTIDKRGQNVYVSSHFLNHFYRIDPINFDITGICETWNPIFTLSNNGKYAYGSTSENISVIDLKSFSLSDRIPLPGKARGIQVGKNLHKVYVNCDFEDNSHALCFVDTKKRIVTATIDIPFSAIRIGINSNNQIAVASGYSQIAFIDLKNQEVISVIDVGPGTIAITFHKAQ